MSEATGRMARGVLVVGAGPVGLALAIELGRRNIDCLLVEKRDGSVTVPKMSAVSARNMEFCRRWSIAERVRTAVWAESHALDFVYLTSLRGRELARMKIPSTALRVDLDYTPEGPCHCPQIYFDPILTEVAAGLPSVELRYETALTGFAEDADGIVATLADVRTGETSTVRARYVVGCDGPAGAVRETLGIGLGGLGVVADSLNIFFRAPELATLHDKGWARFYRAIDETGCWAELIAIDGRELWRLTVFDVHRSPGTPGDHLRRVVGCDFPFEIVSAMPWERRDVVADSYGGGRAFIAGDAAHQCSPTGGLGMHTGIEDAVNIAWKLQAVLEGWGGAGLLDSYGPERHPIGARNVGLATRAFRQITGIPGGPALEADTQQGADRRAALARATQDLRRYTISEADKAQICYEGSPICLADGSPPAATVEEAGRYVASARPGSRAPHGWIEPGVSILDLFGDGFVLLDFAAADGAVAAIGEAVGARGVPLRTIAISNAGLAEIYERRLVLVRPDGHVAWRGDDAPGDPLALADLVRGAGI